MYASCIVCTAGWILVQTVQVYRCQLHYKPYPHGRPAYPTSRRYLLHTSCQAYMQTVKMTAAKCTKHASKLPMLQYLVAQGQCSAATDCSIYILFVPSLGTVMLNTQLFMSIIVCLMVCRMADPVTNTTWCSTSLLAQGAILSRGSTSLASARSVPTP